MLDAMTPQQFDEWLAMYRVAPWEVACAVNEEKPKCPTPLEVMRAQAGV